MTAPTDLSSTHAYRANPDGTLSVDDSYTPEQIASIERLVARVGAFLHNNLSDYPLDAAACCLVVAARIVDLCRPAGVTLEHLQTWARERWRPVRGIANLRGFKTARGKLAIPQESDEELRELTYTLWLITRETSREPGAMDLCGMTGPLLQMAAALARQSLQVNANDFDFAAGLAWTWQDNWLLRANQGSEA